jgi:hypothetical protein
MLSLHRTLSLGYLRQHPTRAVLVVLSIALGIAILVATQALNRGLADAAHDSVNPLAGLADLLVYNAQPGVEARLADELRAQTSERGLAVGPAARTAGGTLAGARTGVADRFLERNQALRLAVLDASHLVTLLDYIAALTTDERLSAFAKRWAARFRDHGRTARDAVTALAADPGSAIAPLDRSPLGRAAHGVAYGVGYLGEVVDGRLSR